MRRAAQPTTLFHRLRTAAWLTSLALAAAPIAAETPAHEADTADAAAEAAAPAGLRAFIDPETGELTSTPTRQQVEELSRAIRQQSPNDPDGPLSRSSEGLETFELATGGRGVNLKRRFQSALVITLSSDGDFELVCRDHGAAADHEHAAAAPAAEWAEK